MIDWLEPAVHFVPGTKARRETRLAHLPRLTLA